MKKLNRDQLKYIAILLMLVDHIILVFPVCTGALKMLLDGLSHFTFITMSFFLAQGFRFTHSRERYAKRLLCFALISQLPYMLAFSYGVYDGPAKLNVIVNCFISLMMLWAYESMESGIRRKLMLVCCIIASCFCDCDFMMPISALLFYMAQDDRRKILRGYAVIMFFFLLNGLGMAYEQSLPLLLCLFSECWGIALSGLLLVFCYNGRRMRGHEKLNKWFFYIFYPVHLSVIGILRFTIM